MDAPQACRLLDIFFVRKGFRHAPQADERRYCFFYSVNVDVPFALDGRRMVMRRRQSLLMRSGCSLSVDAADLPKNARLIAVVFEAGESGELPGALSARIAPFVMIEDARLIYALLIQILYERHMRTAQHAQICASLFTVILYYLAEKLEDNGVRPLPERIRAYVAENYMQEISERDAAKALGISVSYLQKLLRRRERTTFGALVNEARVRKAEALLAQTDRPVSSILYECGFNSRQRFNAVFRRYAGATPTEYRRAHRPPAPR